MRSFCLEYPLQTLFLPLPTNILIGIDPIASSIPPIVMISLLYFTHANLRLSLGPLTGLVCGPQVRRIHHSRLGADRNKNFAQFFPFYDRLFGTYYQPALSQFPPTGLR